MIFTKAILQNIEANSEFKIKYASAGSWGQNKLVYLPLTIAILSIFLTYFVYDLSKSDSAYRPYIAVCSGAVLICIILVIIIQRGARKKVLQTIESVPVCITKKVFGNDSAEIYYCIYTTGGRRHDLEFIDTIAEKIINIDIEPDKQLKLKIKNMFIPKLAQPVTFAVPLPVAFTNGEQVYQKQFELRHIGNELKTIIKDNNEKFAVLAFNNVNAQLLLPKDLISKNLFQ